LLANRPLVLVLTTAVVAMTLTVQGFTLAFVVRSSGLAVDPAHAASKEAEVRTWLDEAALEYLDNLRDNEDIPREVLDRLQRRYSARLGRTEDGAWPHGDFARLQRRLLDVQRAELRRLHTDGRVDDSVQRRITHELDRTEEGLIH